MASIEAIYHEADAIRAKNAELESLLLVEREAHSNLQKQHKEALRREARLQAKNEQLQKQTPLDSDSEKWLAVKLASVRFVCRPGRAGVKLMLRGRPVVFRPTLSDAAEEAMRRWGGLPGVEPGQKDEPA
jgi:hypothetical protein